MSFQRKDAAEARAAGANAAAKGEVKAQNGTGRETASCACALPLLTDIQGNRSGSFRTDAAISSTRPAGERTLQRWVPDGGSPDVEGGLERSSSHGHWDQFAENERRFGIRTSYNEDYYTTPLDKSHPQYAQRLAAAEKTAREIERSAPATSHVAEERVMDFSGTNNDQGGDEEDK